MPLGSLISAGIELVSNHYLGLDEHQQMRRQPLLGKVIAIEIRPFPVIFFNISARQLDVLGRFEGEPDSTLSTSLYTLPKLRDPNQLADLIKAGDVDLKGDVRLMQQFAELFTELDWQPEEKLAGLIGDVPAHLLFRQLHLVSQQLRHLGQQTERRLADVATQEWQVAVAKREYGYWRDDVAALRDELQRLEQRINRLV